MMYTAAFLATFAASASAAKAGRTFAVNHFYGQGFLTEGRMDPIVSPGVASKHSHAIQGGSNFALEMTDTTLLDSKCTSSLIKNDKSVYWTPSLYFQDPQNGSFISVPTYYMNVYYFFEESDDDIVAFQPGHRIFVGDPDTRSPPAAGGQSIVTSGGNGPQPIQFTCPRQNYNLPAYPAGSDGTTAGLPDPNVSGAGAGFPDINCDGTFSPLRADIHFPSCYNPAAGLTDYKNNMAFPTQVGAKQNCPQGWVHTPHMFYEVYWNTQIFADLWTPGQGTQPFVLSNGDNTGYSLHGDFISGWDVETLQQIIDNCDAGDSGMDKCPGLIGGINDSGSTCNIPSLIDETIHGVLEALPGNNPVTGWGVSGSPAPAGGSSSSSSAAPVPSTASAASSAGSSAGSGSGYGYTAPVVSSAAAVQTTFSTVSVIPTPAGSSSAAPVYSSSAAPMMSSSSAAPVYASSAASAAPAASSSPASSGSATNPTVPNWSYKGCYSDLLNPRALSGITFAYMGLHNVSTTPCLGICEAKGYSLAGTEYGGQCFCGNQLDGGSMEIDASNCSMACEGNAAELCGGSLALSVFEASASESTGKSRVVGGWRSWMKPTRRHARRMSGGW